MLSINKINKKKLFKTILLFVGINILFNLLPFRLGYNHTNSIKCKIFSYKHLKTNEQIPALSKSKLLLFKPTINYGILGLDVWNMNFLKRVGAKSGDYLICSQFGCYLPDKGKYIGSPIPKDKNTTYYSFYGFMPPGFFAPIGDVERSYDIRIAGIVSTDRIDGVVIRCLYPF